MYKIQALLHPKFVLKFANIVPYTPRLAKTGLISLRVTSFFVPLLFQNWNFNKIHIIYYEESPLSL